MNVTIESLDYLTDQEFDELEKRLSKLLSVWEIKNLRGQAAIFHDDQHIGEPRRELKALHHPTFDVEAEMIFREKPVVDNLAGNMLIHPLTTPIIEINDACTKARGLWWSLGIESLSKHQEKPMAIISLGMVPGTHVKEDGEWKILSGIWQRTTKNEYHAGWVEDMQVTNTRPPLTKEEDKKFLGKYAYQKEERRKAVPEPPHKDTWQQWPNEADNSWMYMNLNKYVCREETGVIRAIIFDLDGVLVFTDQYHYRAWKKLADRLGIYFDEQINNRLRGVSRMESLKIILESQQETQRFDETQKVELAEEKNTLYRTFLQELTPKNVEESVRNTLWELKKRGYYLAVGSSSKNAKMILERTGLTDIFDVISDGNNIERSKPNPEVFLKAAAMLGVVPKECVVVEDAQAGVDAAQAGGMQAIGIGIAANYEKTDIAIKQISELLEIFQ